MELKKQEEKAHWEQMLKEMTMAGKNQMSFGDLFTSGGLILNEVDGDAEGNTEANVPESFIAPTRIYVNKEQKYEGLRSSTSVSLIVGVVLLAAVVVC